MRSKAPRGEGPEPSRPVPGCPPWAQRCGGVGAGGAQRTPQPGGPALPCGFLSQRCPEQFPAGGAVLSAAQAVREPRAGMAALLGLICVEQEVWQRSE